MNEPKPRLRLMLVDDHPVVRAGLRTVSEVDDSIVIVGEAANGAETLLAARQLQPDAILLDIRLPDRSGLDLCREIKTWENPPRILFLTSFADNELVLAAIQAGGDGYLLKNNEPSKIAEALRTIMAGGAVFDPVATRHALTGLAARDEPPQLKSLSPQERKVLAAVAQGMTDKEVGLALDLTPKTVRNYLDRVFQKLEVNTRTQAALYYDRFVRSSSR